MTALEDRETVNVPGGGGGGGGGTVEVDPPPQVIKDTNASNIMNRQSQRRETGIESLFWPGSMLFDL